MRWVSYILFIVLFSSLAFAAQINIDSFDRADNDAVGNNELNGSVWVESSGDWDIKDNTLLSPSVGNKDNVRTVIGNNGSTEGYITFNCSDEPYFRFCINSGTGECSDAPAIGMFFRPDTEKWTINNAGVAEVDMAYDLTPKTTEIVHYNWTAGNFRAKFWSGSYSSEPESYWLNLTGQGAVTGDRFGFWQHNGIDWSGFCQVINVTYGPLETIVLDTSVPYILQNTYEITSPGTYDPQAWRTDEANAVYVNDSTPTVAFTASEATNFTLCNVEGNYTYLRSLGCTECSTNTNPPSVTVHTCTLSYGKRLTEGFNKLYLSGIDASGNENATGSTSGALHVFFNQTMPNVTALIPNDGDYFNVSSFFEIGANATDDDTYISKVYANITVPNGSYYLFELFNTTDWQVKYNTTYLMCDLLGLYRMQIIANDTGNLTNSTQYTTFFGIGNFTRYFNDSVRSTTALMATLNRTYYNFTNATVELNYTDSLQELPNNRVNESWFVNGIDMTGNVLLFHFNNDTSIGENNTLVYDWSGNRNNGTWNGNGKSNGTAKLSAFAGYFDGDGDYVQFSSTGIDTNDPMSYGGWFYFDQLASTKGSMNALIQPSAESDQWDSCLYQHSANNYLYMFGNDYFAVIPPVQTWNHIILTSVLGTDTAKLYLNGVEYSITLQGGGSNVYAPLKISRSMATHGFDGLIDEVAIWNRTLSATEIKNIYDRQKGKYIDYGTYESRAFDASSSVSWSNISWTEEVDYQGELPNYLRNETTDNRFTYGIDMTGNVLLMHFNNDTTIGENRTLVYDWSGMRNNGTWNSSGNSNGSAKLGAFSGYFDGYNDRLSIPDPASGLLELNGTFTISIWMKTLSGYGALISKLTGNPYDGWAFRVESGTLSAYLKNWRDGVKTMNDSLWHHAVFVYYGNTSGQFYADGTIDGNIVTGFITPTVTTNDIYIGEETWNTEEFDFNGTIDELAIWNRSLSADEIYNIYKRGALRLNLSVRSCDDSSCDTESWTDLTNDTTTQTMSLNNNRYFQYRYFFEDIGDANYTETPRLYNVSVGYLDDKIPPKVVFTNPSNNSFITEKYFDFNVSIIDEFGSDIYAVFMFSNGTNPFNVSATNLSGIWGVQVDSYLFGTSLNRVTVFANDSYGNYNNTESIWFNLDLTLPNVTNVTPLRNSVYKSADLINISANVTDNGYLSGVYANITYPNNSIILFQLLNSSEKPNLFNTTFTVPSVLGLFTIYIIANDTLDNRNSTEFTNFSVTINASVAQSSGVIFWFNSSNSTQYGVNASGQDNSIGLLNLTNYENVSILVKMTVNFTSPYHTIILDSDFRNWSVKQNQSLNSTFNFSILCADIQPVSQNATAGSLSGRFRYRFNNTQRVDFTNTTNTTQFNTTFWCPNNNSILAIYRLNLSGYRNISVDYFPDNTSNNFTMYINGTMCGSANLTGFAKTNFTCSRIFNNNPLTISFNISTNFGTNLSRFNNVSSIYIDYLRVFNMTTIDRFFTVKALNSSNYTNATSLSEIGYNSVGLAKANSSSSIWVWVDLNNPPLGTRFSLYVDWGFP